jgi:hypothetical protein
MIIISIFFIGSLIDSKSFAIEDIALILSDPTLDSVNPQFSISENHIYASWVSNVNSHNSDIMFKKINKGSKTFTNTMDISNTSGVSNIIKLRNSKNNVYITWEDKQADHWKLLFRKSQDYGKKFGNIINLSETTGNVHLHDLSVLGKKVFVVWAANENTSSTNKDIFFRKSLDYGDSFGNTINLSKSKDDSLDPHMATNYNGSLIYVVWTECDIKHDDPICSIVFTKSLDQGNTFTIPKKLSNSNLPLHRTINDTAIDNTTNNAYSSVQGTYLFNHLTVHERNNSINPAVFSTLDGKIVYILWEQAKFGEGGSEIFLSVSLNYGKSFNSTINLSNTSGFSRLAHAQLVGEDLYVAWSDTLEHNNTFDVMLRKIDPKNVTREVINLSNNTGNSVSPSILVSNDRIFVVWSDDTNKASMSFWSANISGSSAIVKTITDEQAEIYINPLIFNTEGKVWIAWTEYNDDNHKIVLLCQEKQDINRS